MPENSIVIFTSDENNQSCYYSIMKNGASVELLPLLESIDCIDRQIHDLVLLDCGMEVEDGLTVLRDIKTLHPAIPVIFITELNSEESAVNAFRSGARDYLKKPFKTEELEKSMATLLSIKRQSREQRSTCFLHSNNNEEARDIPQNYLYPGNVNRALRYIEYNLTEQISLEKLASVAHMSKYHFCKIFKRYVGMSPMRYVAFNRVKKAKKLLSLSDLNVSEIAWEVGFNDLSNFNKHFKKITGITPTDYKLILRPSEEQESNFHSLSYN